MLTRGEAMHVWGQRHIWKISIPPSKFCYKVKDVLKILSLKNINFKGKKYHSAIFFSKYSLQQGSTICNTRALAWVASNNLWKPPHSSAKQGCRFLVIAYFPFACFFFLFLRLYLFERLREHEHGGGAEGEVLPAEQGA